MKSAIAIKNLTIKYEGNTVLEDFSYNFQKGFYAITGQSGIGKTSLINAILGLIPYTGTISFDGEPRFSAVFQEDR